jgi:hypothetical protein
MATKKQISRATERDPDLRALRMCVKYLDTVCSERMRVPTMIYLWDRFVANPPPKAVPRG